MIELDTTQNAEILRVMAENSEYLGFSLPGLIGLGFIIALCALIAWKIAWG